ncbi:hypothetical protein CHS0354_031767 [Potamilus streckersoni]|uniref:Uncharacterized protein n=1 Tax=Potamilus streckersoni TaxID=2493646 RepID=A0AAE0VLU0_9BIVA|nr:hypothetical protein CHS0354_031767 [Potamilus streckersoni]
MEFKCVNIVDANLFCYRLASCVTRREESPYVFDTHRKETLTFTVTDNSQNDFVFLFSDYLLHKARLMSLCEAESVSNILPSIVISMDVWVITSKKVVEGGQSDAYYPGQYHQFTATNHVQAHAQCEDSAQHSTNDGGDEILSS